MNQIKFITIVLASMSLLLFVNATDSAAVVDCTLLLTKQQCSSQATACSWNPSTDNNQCIDTCPTLQKADCNNTCKYTNASCTPKVDCSTVTTENCTEQNACMQSTNCSPKNSDQWICNGANGQCLDPIPTFCYIGAIVNQCLPLDQQTAQCPDNVNSADACTGPCPSSVQYGQCINQCNGLQGDACTAPNCHLNGQTCEPIQQDVCQNATLQSNCDANLCKFTPGTTFKCSTTNNSITQYCGLDLQVCNNPAQSQWCHVVATQKMCYGNNNYCSNGGTPNGCSITAPDNEHCNITPTCIFSQNGGPCVNCDENLCNITKSSCDQATSVKCAVEGDVCSPTNNSCAFTDGYCSNISSGTFSWMIHAQIYLIALLFML